MKTIVLAAAFAAGLASIATAQVDPKPVPAEQAPVFETARPYPQFGFEANFADKTDFGVGLRYESGMGFLLPRASNIRFVGSFNYYFPSGPLKYWEANANLLNLFELRNVRANPYVGAGLNIATSSTTGASNTEAGLNLLGGIRLMGRFSPYLETRLTVGGASQLQFTAGMMVF